jgi:hypothetical protein
MVRDYKKLRGVGGKGDERRRQEKDGSICRVPSPIYPPLPAEAQWARCFVTAPSTGQTQAVTRGPRSHALVSAGLKSNSSRKMTVQKRIAPRIPYVWRFIGLGIADTISTTPKENSGAEMDRPANPVCAAFRQFGNHGRDLHDPHDSRCAVSHQFRIVVMIALGPVTPVA